MSNIFGFGEQIEAYDFKVINENEARASAGIMFLFGLIALFSVSIHKSLFWAELFSITFIIEFVIRVLINPKYAPYMLLGSLVVSNQEEQWIEAKPKKFAWVLGLILGVIMGYFIVFNVMSPVRLLVCILCLALLYLESSFGICLGCIVYAKLNVKLEKCPNNICKPKNKKSKKRYLLIFLFMTMFFALYYGLKTYKYQTHTKEKIEHKSISISGCNAPQWAVDLGHKEMWEKHHCK